MSLLDARLPIWFESNGFEEYSDILTKELGVEEYDDFKLLRDEKDANELLCDMSSFKSMDEKFKQKFKKEIMKIIENKDFDFIPKQTNPNKTSKQSHKLKQSKQPKTPPSAEKKRSLAKPSKHKKSHSVLNIRRKPKQKQKTLSPKESKKEKQKRSKTPTRKQRSVTTVRKPDKKRHKIEKKEQERDTYDIDSISFKMNKKSNVLNKSLSKHHKASKSLNNLDMKRRKKIHKEEKNKARGGFTVHTNRRVRLDDGRIGIVKYKGRTSFGKSSEDWIGIVVEYGKGQHNGTVNGRAYFRCREGKGIMVKPDRIVQDLGNPNTKKLDDEMKKGSEEIQKIIKETARKRKQERIKKKKNAQMAAAAKEKSNYGGDVGWKPATFEDYKPDESTGLYQQKLMHSKTLLDKNKNVKAVKKKKISEI